MNKDVIYIDVEDDVTAIIGKVKEAKAKVVALVPPKRTGVLQSAVNLRILLRTAKAAGKHLVLITNDQSLIPLAAGAGIPIAKNLQSKPEIPEIAALKIDDDDDIIDGSQLPVGDHAATTESPKMKAAGRHIPVTTADTPPRATPPRTGELPRTPKGPTSVPNFNKFRKKLVLIVLAIIGLIGFLVWAIWFAPQATVEITAKTSDSRVNTSVVLGTTQQTSAAKATLKTVQMQDKQEATAEFEATGTEEQGEKASGVVTLSNCGSRNSVTVSAGTAVSYGNYNFITSKTVEVAGGKSSTPFGGCDRPGTASVSVVAQNIGEEYNLAAKTAFDVAGGEGLSASNSSAFTGGSKKTLKIVTQADVQRAAEQLAKQDENSMKSKLQQKFGKGVMVIDSSFRTTSADTVSSPEVGKEAPDGKAKLAASVTYVMEGVSDADLKEFVKEAVQSKLSKENEQRIYEVDLAGAQLTDFAATDTGGTANLSAVAKVGPLIKDSDIKSRVAGKRFGDIQADLKSIQGVENVEVRLSPFWVSKVPNDENKIKVEFKLTGAAKNAS